jgi:hypothetical protein
VHDDVAGADVLSDFHNDLDRLAALRFKRMRKSAAELALGTAKPREIAQSPEF